MTYPIRRSPFPRGGGWYVGPRSRPLTGSSAARSIDEWLFFNAAQSAFRSAVGSVVSGAYAVRAAAWAVAAGGYVVELAAGADAAGGYTVRGAAGSQESGQWSIRQAVGASSEQLYNVASMASSGASADGSYTVRASVWSQPGGGWDIAATAGSTAGGSWVVDQASAPGRSPVGATADGQYVVDGQRNPGAGNGGIGSGSTGWAGGWSSTVGPDLTSQDERLLLAQQIDDEDAALVAVLSGILGTLSVVTAAGATVRHAG